MKTKNKFKLGPIQEKWLSMLESGEIKQTTEQLCYFDEDTGEKSYCCLGVGALVLKKKINFDHFGTGVVDGEDMELKSYKRIGLRSEFGKIVGDKIPDLAFAPGSVADPCLANLNDRGWSFKRIAKFIRQNPEAVFTKSC